MTTYEPLGVGGVGKPAHPEATTTLPMSCDGSGHRYGWAHMGGAA